MNNIILLLNLLVILSGFVLGRELCPAIRYESKIEAAPDHYSVLSSSHVKSFTLNFINQSPFSLDFLDVHYAINNENDYTNIRLVEENKAKSMPVFTLAETQPLHYFFTYQIQGLTFACDTPIANLQGADLLKVQKSNNTKTAMPVVHQTESTVPVKSAEPKPSYTPEMLQMPQESSGVCPLIQFSQNIKRLSKNSNQYQMSFENLSPQYSLSFLDVHYQTGENPTTNLRLYNDKSMEETANIMASSAPVTLEENEKIKYSFTYGVDKLACDTEIFNVSPNEIA